MPTQYEKVTKRQLVFSILFVLMYPVIILSLAGDIFWIEGWIFSIIFILTSLTSLIYLYYKDPALLSERLNVKRKDQKGWDKIFLLVIAIIYFIWLAIMPLDAKRFGWSVEFPLWLEVCGGIIFLLSFYFTFRSFAENTFLSPVIRVQKERNQQVVSTGVYAIVRHPMYVGSILMFIGIPILLGSIYGIILSLLMCLLLIPRIIGEEKMLEEELEGYKEYKQKVKYRLIPFIW